MSNETQKRLHDVLQACRAIRAFTEGMRFPDDERSDLIRAAVERKLEIIGEAFARAAAADATIVERLPDVARIIGLRNRVIHGYDSVDDEIFWDVVRTKVPDLERRVAALLGDGKGGSGDGPA
jgi:uncharacterized protein with HEPN domain